MEKIRIFLTDDNDEIRAALHKYLEAQEDMIISGEAANGVEALQRLPECPSDVIILDLIMPQMDGFGVLEQVQRIPPEQRPRVIALTALGREDFIARALRLGVNYYMVKPVEMSQLMDRVRDSARQMEGVCEEPPELPPPPSPNVDDRMSNIFLSLGIPAHIKGYQYLRHAIMMVIDDLDIINSMLGKSHRDFLKIKKIRLEILLGNQENAMNLLLSSQQDSPNFVVDVMKGALFNSKNSNQIVSPIVAALIDGKEGLSFGSSLIKSNVFIALSISLFSFFANIIPPSFCVNIHIHWSNFVKSFGFLFLYFGNSI